MRLIDSDELYRIEKLLGTNIVMQNTVARVLLDQVLHGIQNMPEIDAVPVVRCKDCVSHDNCLTEDTFHIARIQNPYCCGGRRKETNT